MRIVTILRETLKAAAREQPCRPCTHFCDDPARQERELPGLTALSSTSASVRDQDGLCLRHGLIINGRRRCPAFSPAVHQP
jgi:hypothetical protein